MKKYSVVQKPSADKTSSSDHNRVCPQCGQTTVTRQGVLLVCTLCGTEPWEKPKEQ